jgi:hypothetical protein
MLEQLKNTPNTMVGFRVKSEITKEDFDQIALPAIAELVQRTDKLNYLLILDTPAKIPTTTDWIKEAMVTLNNLNKWNRVAIVTDADIIQPYAELFSKIIPGEFKGFSHNELHEAIQWVGEQDQLTNTEIFQKEGETFD